MHVYHYCCQGSGSWIELHCDICYSTEEVRLFKVPLNPILAANTASTPTTGRTAKGNCSIIVYNLRYGLHNY